MKRDYLTRLSRIARWKLPPEEAREVVEDYREMIDRNPRSDEELCQELGKPAEAIKLITQKKSYYSWLVVFVVLVVCIMLPAETPMPLAPFKLWGYLIDSRPFSIFARMFLLVAGLVISQIWFRTNGVREKGSIPRKMLALLVIQFLWLIWTWAVAWLVLTFRDNFFAGLFLGKVTRSTIIADSLIYGGFVMALIGVYGLVRARMSDRRWLAVYALGFTVSAMCVAVTAVLHSMRLDPSVVGWQMPIIREYVALTVIGLIGTGVSLC